MEEFYRAMMDYAKILWRDAEDSNSPTAEHYKEEYEHYKEKYYEACAPKKNL